MAISPPGDLVLDVMRAADPRQARIARDRLLALSGAPAPAAATRVGMGNHWQGALRQAAPRVRQASPAQAASVPAGDGPLRLGKAPDVKHLAADGRLKHAAGTDIRETAQTRQAPGTSRIGMPQAHATKRLRQAYAGLEGVLVANMLDGMLGNGRGNLFGGGLAGSYWKSLLAQAVATQVARRGGLGLAASLAPLRDANGMPTQTLSTAGSRPASSTGERA